MWRQRSLRCCAGSLFRSQSGMGNPFTPAYLTRRRLAVYLHLQRCLSPQPTRLFSIRPPSLSHQGTTSTFPPRRPPDSPGETFGVHFNSVSLFLKRRPRFNARTHLELHQMFSECFSNLNIQISTERKIFCTFYFHTFLFLRVFVTILKNADYILASQVQPVDFFFFNYPLRYCICICEVT